MLNECIIKIKCRVKIKLFYLDKKLNHFCHQLPIFRSRIVVLTCKFVLYHSAIMSLAIYLKSIFVIYYLVIVYVFLGVSWYLTTETRKIRSLRVFTWTLLSRFDLKKPFHEITGGWSQKWYAFHTLLLTHYKYISK